MAQNDKIYISRRLISEKWCSKPKYLSTLIDIAFDALPTGHIILTDLKCRPKKYLESVEARERRQSISWLIRNNFLTAEKLPPPYRGVYRVSLSEFALQFIKVKEG